MAYLAIWESGHNSASVQSLESDSYTVTWSDEYYDHDRWGHEVLIIDNCKQIITSQDDSFYCEGDVYKVFAGPDAQVEAELWLRTNEEGDL